MTAAFLFFFHVSVFFFLVAVVARNSPIIYVDIELSHNLCALIFPKIDCIATLTQMGRPILLAIPAIFLGISLLFSRQKTLIAFWIATMIGGVSLNLILKQIFKRVRPEFLGEHMHDQFQGWSFPSGHTTIATLFCSMICHISFHFLSTSWKRIFVIISTWIMLTVGFSRVIIGLHYLSDIIAGFTSTSAWILLCFIFASMLSRWCSASNTHT